MVDRNFWVIPAKPEEQGSFCDTDSGITYENSDKREVEDKIESAYYRGNSVVYTEEETDRYPDSQRFNVAMTDVDGKNHDYPSKYEPGR